MTFPLMDLGAGVAGLPTPEPSPAPEPVEPSPIPSPPTPTPPAEPAEARPEPATPDPLDLGPNLAELLSGAREGIDPAQPPPGEADPNHFIKVRLRQQDEELARLRGENTSLRETPPVVPPPEAPSELTNDHLVEPSALEAYLQDREDRLMAKVDAKAAESRKDIDPVLEQGKHDRAMRTVFTSSPLAQQLMNRPEVGDWLNRQVKDPVTAQSYTDMTRVRLEAGLFRVMSKLLSAQATTKAAAPLPPRPENAGRVGPGTGSGGGGSPRPKSEGDKVKEMSPQEAWTAMQGAARNLGML